MAAVPQLLKTIVFSLGASDFSDDLLDAEVVPTPGDIQQVTTLDGVNHQDIAAPTWGLRLRMIVDWDTVRPGLAYYLFNNAGDSVAMIFQDTTGGISTTKPGMAGNVRLVPVSYGGTGNEYAEAEVVLPFVVDPTVDIAP